MMKQPLFSVLIANYNNKEFLEECVDSVKKQTYQNWECIIVDDCSTDNPSKIYEELKRDSRIKIYLNDENRKTAYTFKRALDLSNGEICGFLGPDDTLHNEAIEKTVMAHQENNEMGLVYTLNYICDKNLGIIGYSKWGGVLPNGESQLTVPAGKKITNFITFKKDFYTRTEAINVKFIRGFDQDFCYKMEEVGRVYCINEYLYNYRVHDGNISLNENNIKAHYWLYVANRDAYYRRKKSKLKIKNISLGELKRTYLKVCLLKIDQKFRFKEYKNLFFYYCQLLRLLIWDKELFVIKAHIHFFKRLLLKLIKGREGSPLQYN